MDRNDNLEALVRFEVIMDEIKELTDEALEILKRKLGKGRRAVSTAEVYWNAQIKSIVDGDGSMETMKKSFDILSEEIKYPE